MAGICLGTTTVPNIAGAFLHWTCAGPLKNNKRKRRAEARRNVLVHREAIRVLDRLSEEGSYFYSYTTLYKDEGYWKDSNGRTSNGDYKVVELLHEAGYVDLFDNGKDDGYYFINADGKAWLSSMKASAAPADNTLGGEAS